jgi:hypothetical protein
VFSYLGLASGVNEQVLLPADSNPDIRPDGLVDFHISSGISDALVYLHIASGVSDGLVDLNIASSLYLQIFYGVPRDLVYLHIASGATTQVNSN